MVLETLRSLPPPSTSWNAAKKPPKSRPGESFVQSSKRLMPYLKSSPVRLMCYYGLLFWQRDITNTTEALGGVAMNQNQNQNHSEETNPNERLQLLVQRAVQGDRSVLPALKEFLDAYPEVWQEAGNLALLAERASISVAAGPNLLVGQSLQRQCDAMRAELLGLTSTPIEKLLVDRVVQSWFQAYHADFVCAQGCELSVPKKAFLLRRQAQAHKGYLAAIQALTTYRKLLPKGKSKQEAGPESSVAAHAVEASSTHFQTKNQGADESMETLPDFLAQRMRGLVGSEN